MTDQKAPDELSDDALDQASGGLNPSRTYKITDGTSNTIIAAELDAGSKVIEFQDGDDYFLRK